MIRNPNNNFKLNMIQDTAVTCACIVYGILVKNVGPGCIYFLILRAKSNSHYMETLWRHFMMEFYI